jgi:hypothetical protein
MTRYTALKALKALKVLKALKALKVLQPFLDELCRRLLARELRPPDEAGACGRTHQAGSRRACAKGGDLWSSMQTAAPLLRRRCLAHLERRRCGPR